MQRSLCRFRLDSRFSLLCQHSSLTNVPLEILLDKSLPLDRSQRMVDVDEREGDDAEPKQEDGTESARDARDKRRGVWVADGMGFGLFISTSCVYRRLTCIPRLNSRGWPFGVCGGDA